MGKLFGGGKKSTQKSESKETSTNTNLLTQNKDYVNLFNQGVTEGANAPIIPFELAGLDENYQKAIEAYSKGVDTTQYTNAADKLNGAAERITGNAEENLANYQSIISRIGSMTQQDYQNMMKSEYNSELVKSQIAEATQNINDEYGSQVRQLNESASMTGNMGNSRAGVAQGVMAGQAQKAIGSATVQYQTAEESAAANRLQTYLGNQMNAATAGANLATQQQALGYNLFGQGMQYRTQGNQYQLQNQQQALKAGEMRRTYAQQVIDINRQNQLLNLSPSLTRLGLINATLAPVANFSTQGQSNSFTSTTTTTPNEGLAKTLGLVGTVAGSAFGPMGGMVGGMVGTMAGNAMA